MGKPSFLKKGKAAKKAKAKSEASSGGGNYPFWMKPDTDTSITFLDGNLDDDGLLENAVYEQHTMPMPPPKKFESFVCVADEEPCPMCATGDAPTLVSAFTIIDHSSYEKDGKTYKDNKRLFIAKPGTLKLLQKMATKRGGLAGCRFDVSRTDKKKANVGDIFDFDKKLKPKKLAAKYKDSEPFDYEKEIKYYTAKELRNLGIGEAPMGGTDEPPWEEKKKKKKGKKSKAKEPKKSKGKKSKKADKKPSKKPSKKSDKKSKKSKGKKDKKGKTDKKFNKEDI